MYRITLDSSILIISSTLFHKKCGWLGYQQTAQNRVQHTEYLSNACCLGGAMEFSAKSLEKAITFHKKNADTAASQRQNCTLSVRSLYSGMRAYGRKIHLFPQTVTITWKIYCRKLSNSFQWEVQKLPISDSETSGNISPHFLKSWGQIKL